MKYDNIIQNSIFEHQCVIIEIAKQVSEIEAIGKCLLDVLLRGNKILICGNGGSAADAQHFAAELTGRFETERRPLPGLALTTDTSALTAIGNDYGFDEIFVRQLRALGVPGDLLIAISTSGNSRSVISAVNEAKAIGMTTVGFLGRDGGKIALITDLNFVVPSSSTARIQEGHILLVHLLCQLIDEAF
ncbi:MAG: D-sedoheptulose 7-phosphate isomerase [Chlorobium phaeovibrioides]|nr:D-sedoheptulose 7-phosphate isomerase [Chlorobium phaeovibrioides]